MAYEDLVAELGNGKVMRPWRGHELDPGSNDSISYGHLETVESGFEPTDLWVSDYLGGSDYSGGTAYRSNYEVFIEKFGEVPGVHEIHGGYGSYGVGVELQTLAAETEAAEEMRETFEGLENYPVIDDEAMSQLENEREDEAWNSFYRRDFRKALVKRFTDELGAENEEVIEEAVDAVSDEKIDELFYEARDRANEYWEHSAEGPYIDVEKIANVVEPEEVISLAGVQTRIPGTEERRRSRGRR